MNNNINRASTNLRKQFSLEARIKQAPFAMMVALINIIDCIITILTLGLYTSTIALHFAIFRMKRKLLYDNQAKQHTNNNFNNDDINNQSHYYASPSIDDESIDDESIDHD